MKFNLSQKITPRVQRTAISQNVSRNQSIVNNYVNKQIGAYCPTKAERV